MTGRFRIALIGLPAGVGAALGQLFHESGFEPEAFPASAADPAAAERFGEYDLVIADPSAGGSDEERFFGFLLSTRSFLLTGPGTGLEEILSAAQDVLYGGDVPGVPPRKVPRVRVELHVTYEAATARRESVVRTLSENGAFIAALDPPPAGTRVTLILSLPEGWGRVAASGRALYSIGYDLGRGIIARAGAPGRKIGAYPGFGVAFDDISETDRGVLRRYIEGKRYDG